MPILATDTVKSPRRWRPYDAMVKREAKEARTLGPRFTVESTLVWNGRQYAARFQVVDGAHNRPINLVWRDRGDAMSYADRLNNRLGPSHPLAPLAI